MASRADKNEADAQPAAAPPTPAEPEEFLPLSRSTAYILLSLAEGPKHGYAILKDVEARSEGELRLGIGNLYVALKRLVDQGLIEPAGAHEGGGDDRRRVYRLTGLGDRVRQAQLARWAADLRRAGVVLPLRPVLQP